MVLQGDFETDEVILVPDSDSDEPTETPSDYTVCLDTCYNPSSYGFSPSHSQISDNSALICPSELLPYGVCIQPVIRALICIPCDCALTCKTLSNHIHDCHPNIASHIPTTLLDHITNKYNIVHTLPNITGPIPPIDGLTVRTGLVECPECKRIYSRDSLRAHHSKDHSGVARGHLKDLRNVHVQRLNSGSHKSYFEVFPTCAPNQIIGNENLLLHMRKARDSTIESYSPDKLDARVITPWLRAVHWYDHVQSFTTNTLRELVEMPSKGDPLYNLKDGVLNLFEMAYRIIPDTDLLILQRLNTDDALKGSVLCNTLISLFTCLFFSESIISHSRRIRTKAR